MALPAHVAGGHQLLCGLAGMGTRILVPLARTAASLAPHEFWYLHGYRTVHDFTRESLRRSARWLRDLERLHAALDALPALEPALTGADGGKPLGLKAALCIARVASREDVASWIEEARRLTLPALQRVVRERREREAAAGRAAGVEGEAAGKEAESRTNRAASDAAGSEADALDQATDARVSVRLIVPPEVKLAFDAVKDLHAAVVGRDTGPEALIEAMLGEAASAGWTPLDGLHARLRERFTRTVREREMGDGQDRREGSRDVSVGDSSDVSISTNPRASMAPNGSTGSMSFSPAMRKAYEALHEFELLQGQLRDLEAKTRSAAGERPATRNIRSLVEILRRLIRLQDRFEIVMGALLLEMHERKAWRLLGHAGLEAYAEECLGVGRSTARRRVSLARRLRRHALTRRAYESGRLGEEAALWAVRRLERGEGGGGAAGADGTESGEAQVIAHAASCAVKRLRDEETLLRRDELLWRIDVARGMEKSARRAPWIEERRQVARPGLPDDAAWHASLERRPGEKQDRIVGLEHGLLQRIVRQGPLLEVPLLLSLGPDLASEFLSSIESLRRALCGVPEESPAAEGRLRPSVRMARQFLERRESVPAWLGLLALLEECLFVWDEPSGMPRRPQDRVYQRDGYRCTAPGCTARAKLEAHHLVYRSRGGTDALDNLTVCCVFHHQQGEHGSLAQVRGKAPLGVTWRLGAEDFATLWRNEKRIEGAEIST